MKEETRKLDMWASCSCAWTAAAYFTCLL